MKISKILGLTSPCPHCDAQISRAKRLKNLLFCPVCGGSLLLKPEAQHNPDSTQKMFLWYFLASVGFALWHTTEHQGWEIRLYVEPIISLLLICCFGWIIFALMTGRLYRDGASAGKWLSGVDQLEIVQKDLCPEYGTPRTSLPQSVVVQCPHCQSQRVSDRYWYKRSMAQDGKLISHENNEVEDDLFLGCLACGSSFAFQKSVFNREQRKVVLMTLLVTVVFIAFSVLAFWLFNLGKQQMGWVSQFSCFWLSGASWFAVMLLPKKISELLAPLMPHQDTTFLAAITADDQHSKSPPNP